MAKFEFDPYDPTVEQEIVFDAAHYPDPASETETRKQLSCPLAQLKDFINSYLDENGKIAPGNVDASGVSVDDTSFTHFQGHNVQAVLEAADWLSLPVPDGINGKTLKVVNQEWKAVDPDLPVVTSADNGKIASVVDGKWDKSTFIPSELPDVTVADNGKILKVFNGEWVAVEPGPATVLLDDTLTFEPVPGKSDYYCEVDVEFTGRQMEVAFDGEYYLLNRKRGIVGINCYGAAASSSIRDYSKYPIGIVSTKDALGHEDSFKIYVNDDLDHEVKILVRQGE